MPHQNSKTKNSTNRPSPSSARELSKRADDLEVYTVATRSAPETIEAFQHWAGPDDKIESFDPDNAPELKGPARKLVWRMPTSTPGVPKINGLIERMVRKCKGGA